MNFAALAALGLLSLNTAAHAQTLYVGDANPFGTTGSIRTVAPDGTVTSFATTGLATDGQEGLAFGWGGDLFVAGDSHSNRIDRVDASGTVNAFVSNISADAIVFVNGNLFVTDSSSGRSILKIDTLGNVSAFATGIGSSEALTADGNGNLYALGGTGIQKIDALGNVSDFATFSGGDALTYSQGNLYADNNGLVSKIDANGNATLLGDTGLGTLEALAVDATGNVYAVAGSSQVIKLDSSGNATLYANGFSTAQALIFSTPSATPEPGSMALLVSMGVSGLAVLRRRARRK